MRVLVVDHHILFREGLISLLKQDEEFQVVEQAGSVREALEKTAARQPDVLLLDDHLPDGNGIEIIPTLLQLSPETKIILFTIFEDEQSHLKALQSGTKGYLTKRISYAQLVDSIKALGSGKASLTDNNATPLPVKSSQETNSGNDKNNSDRQFLTYQEREVFDQLGMGATNQEIADRLGITTQTVKDYISTIVDKLHLSDRLKTQRFAASGYDRQNKKIDKPQPGD